MKIRTILTFISLILTIMATAQNPAHENPVMIEHTSRYDFAKTVDTLSDIVLAHGWKVIVTHDLQETMKKNGKEVLPVKVMEICNPGLAYQILSKDELRDASPMLPCRISVYEKADGKTYISRMNAPAFAEMIGGDAAKTIVEAFHTVEGFLKEVIQ
jgi:uncharacterized protein (DUF302 family)